MDGLTLLLVAFCLAATTPGRSAVLLIDGSALVEMVADWLLPELCTTTLKDRADERRLIDLLTADQVMLWGGCEFVVSSF